jgi:energy coupling factor transporter S component ThiW
MINEKIIKLDRTRSLVLMGLFVALGTITSHLLWFPAGMAKAFPVQHAINVLAGIILGPGPAVLVAFTIGLLRNILGLGTLLAFPGGMIGAFLAGWFYQRYGKDILALVGEVLGTGVIGSLLSVPVANFLLGKSVTALFFIIPFTISSFTGAILAYFLLKALRYYITLR